MATHAATSTFGEPDPATPGRGATEPHPFLSGIHAPMRQELTLTALPVDGAIPTSLRGRYLRIGPNPARPDPAGHHWFSGDGMVHGLAIADGKALWYRNRWIRSGAVAEALGEPPAAGPRRGPNDTVNTNVVDIAGRVLALVEGGSTPVELSRTLDDQRYTDFDGTLAGSFTAHPHRDPLTGEHHGICYEGRRPSEIRHVVIDRAGRVVREEPIAVEHGPMIHDCAITARYVVILDLPVTFSPPVHLAGQALPYTWNPDHRARVGLMPRSGGARTSSGARSSRPTSSTPPTPTTFPTDGWSSTSAPTRRCSRARRAGPTRRCGGWSGGRSIPRPARRRSGRSTTRRRSSRGSTSAGSAGPIATPYTVATRRDRLQNAGRLYKHDLARGGREVHDFGPGRHTGEFVFTPAHDDAAEDEGWLIGLVIDEPADATDLVILDARRFEAAPVAVVRLPHRIPPGFHGNWLADGEAR